MIFNIEYQSFHPIVILRGDILGLGDAVVVVKIVVVLRIVSIETEVIVDNHRITAVAKVDSPSCIICMVIHENIFGDKNCVLGSLVEIDTPSILIGCIVVDDVLVDDTKTCIEINASPGGVRGILFD